MEDGFEGAADISIIVPYVIIPDLWFVGHDPDLDAAVLAHLGFGIGMGE